jgi:hypothetical protein
MVRIRPISVTITFAALSIIGFTAAAQTPVTATEQVPGKLRVSPNQQFPPMPPSNRNLTIELRQVDRMSEADRRLEASSEAAVFRRAELWGMNLSAGKWTVEQVSCPALPDHLLLRYTRNGGPRDVSIFSASIPRQGGASQIGPSQIGPVRVMPLVRRGYGLYTPAQVNPLTMATFNRVRAEEKRVQNPDWLAAGLCYAAFAGSIARIDAPEAEAPEPKTTFPAWIPTVMMTVAGEAVVEFTDNAAKPQPMQWTLSFDAQGKLVQAVHEANPALKVLRIVGEPTEPQGPAIHSTVGIDPGAPVIHGKDSSEPDGPVIHSPNDNKVPLPKGVEPDPKIPQPSQQ